MVMVDTLVKYTQKIKLFRSSRFYLTGVNCGVEYEQANYSIDSRKY